MTGAAHTALRLRRRSRGKAEVNRSTFQGADLTGADLSKAELARVVLSGAKAGGVDFSYSNLGRADLRKLDLSGADFTGSYLFLTLLDGADLSRAKGLKQEQLGIACGTSETKLPAGLTRPQNWPCSEKVEQEG